jgi:hypothetical protein
MPVLQEGIEITADHTNSVFVPQEGIDISDDHTNSVFVPQEGVDISDDHTNSLSSVFEIPDSFWKSLLYSFSGVYFPDSTIHDRFFIKKWSIFNDRLNNTDVFFSIFPIPEAQTNRICLK